VLTRAQWRAAFESEPRMKLGSKLNDQRAVASATDGKPNNN